MVWSVQTYPRGVLEALRGQGLTVYRAAIGRRDGRLPAAFLEEVVSELHLEARFGVRLVFKSWFCHLLAV